MFILPQLSDLIDLVLVAGVIWLAIRSLRRTRARSALIGLAFVPVVFLAANALELRLMATLLQGFFAISVVLLVVMFQEDLRRFFEEVGAWRPERAVPSPQDGATTVLVQALAHLASSRTGALVVLPGKEPFERHLTGGVPLQGRLSAPLLLSLFDASSPGHDGAIIVRDGLLERFAVHLPLSSDRTQLGERGTRHAAALGLAERCDATVIAVSEERGTISVARDGRLRVVDGAQALVAELSEEQASPTEPDPADRRRRLLDGAIAISLSTVLWLFLVAGAESVTSEIEVPITLTNVPADKTVERIEPETARLVVRGTRRALFTAGRTPVRVEVDAYLARLGRRTFTLESTAVDLPTEMTLQSIDPQKIRVHLRDAPGAAPATAPTRP